MEGGEVMNFLLAFALPLIEQRAQVPEGDKAALIAQVNAILSAQGHATIDEAVFNAIDTVLIQYVVSKL